MKTLDTNNDVRIIHFASRGSNISKIIEETNKTLLLKPLKTFTIYSYFEYDPIVVSKQHDDSITLFQCIVNSIDYRTATINLRIVDTDEIKNNRKVDRYPVSLVGKIVNYSSDTTLYIENIGTGGIKFITNEKLEIGNKIEIESTVSGSYINFIGNIAWVKKQSNLNEYGLEFINTSPDITRIIKLVKKEHIQI